MHFLRFLSVSAVLALPQAAFAQARPITACDLVTGLPCASGGAAGAVIFAQARLFPALMSIFVAVCLLFFFYYAVRLMLESEDESTITETKSAYGYAIAGVAVVSLSQFIVDGTGINGGAPNVVNAVPVNSALRIVVNYLLAMTSAAVTAMIVFQAFRIILLQGQESEMEQQKKRFFHGLLGVAVILLAGPMVTAFLPGTGSNILSAEIVGIINFLLTIFGALCVLGIIVAGIMMLVSTDESLKDRAKKAIFTTVIALIVVLSSYLIVRFVATL